MMAKVVAVCGLVAVLGIISVISGFAAEATRVKPSEVLKDQLSCVYPSSRPAVVFGITSAILAIVARIVILMSAPYCCFRPPSGSTSIRFFSYFNILSWIASVVAVILLFGGIVLNIREDEQKDLNGRVVSCHVVKPGIFAVGGVLALLSAYFGIVVYVSVYSAKQTTSRLALGVATNVDQERNLPHV